MKKALLFALLAIALVAMPAAASVQNVKVSGDIDTTWLVRDQFDLGSQTRDENFYQNLVLTQTRLRVDADLTDNVSATVALINERVWGEDSDTRDITSGGATTAVDIGDNDIDLNLAFVELREMLYSPLTVIIGRQNFAYGNSFVIDSAGSNNVVTDGGLVGAAQDLTKRTALDAVRLVLDYNPLTIDIVAAKVDTDNVSGGEQLHDDDVDLFGTNANYKLGDDMNTEIEAYFWAKIDQEVKDSVAAGSNAPKADSVYMPGVRASANVLKGLSVSAELAAQFGTKTNTSAGTAADNVNRRATAAQVIANYALPFEETAEWSPVLTTVYTYTSGDSNAAEPGNAAGGNGEDTFTAWDPMFENQAGGTIYNSLFDLTNSHIATVKLALNPMEDVTVWTQYDGIWLDKRVDDTTPNGTCTGAGCFTMRQPDGTTINPTVTTNTKVGDEAGIGVIYDYTEDVQFGGSLNWFFPGDFFDGTNNQAASQVLIHGNVIF